MSLDGLRRTPRKDQDNAEAEDKEFASDPAKLKKLEEDGPKTNSYKKNKKQKKAVDFGNQDFYQEDGERKQVDQDAAGHQHPEGEERKVVIKEEENITFNLN